MEKNKIEEGDIEISFTADNKHLYTSKIKEITLIRNKQNKVSNGNPCIFETKLIYDITNINGEHILSAHSQQKFTFHDWVYGESGKDMIMYAINKSYTCFYNKIYDLNIPGYLMNEITSHFLAASQSDLNSVLDIG